jgi:hypothetical protein
MQLGDGFPACAKAVLEKVSFQHKLPYCFEHLRLFLLQHGLLSAGLLGLPIFVKCAAGVFNELLFPVSQHVGVYAVVSGNLAQLPLTLEYLQNQLCLVFRCVIASCYGDSSL